MNPRRTEIRIFEVGFGTGLNTLLAVQWASKRIISIEYTSIENNPLDKFLTKELNYGPILNMSPQFSKIHDVEWNTNVIIECKFHLHKIIDDFTTYKEGNNIDVIFFDAFAPGKQPEMWHHSNLLKCYNMLNEKGVFVTYSVKGQVKRDLRSIGFSIESLPGPPGKSQMLRAIKNCN